MNLLEASNLRVSRGNAQVLDVPSFTLLRGGRMALVGPNGSGKTTLLLTLAGLLPPETGSLRFDNHPVSNLFGYRRRIAMVFQQPLLFDTTVRENIASGLRLRHTPASDIAHQVEHYAARFGITHLLDRSARKLSGGEAQRTSLARGLATHPEILFLDEPFASLDRPTADVVIHDLQKAIEEAGTALLFATHNQDEALRLSSEMTVMNAGKIVQTGPTPDIINHPADPFVASFLGTETILPGKAIAIERDCLRVSVGTVEIEATGDANIGDPVTLCIRPESVAIASAPPTTHSSARNTFTAKIQRILPRRHYHRIELDAGCFLVAHVTLHSLEEMHLAEGMSVTVSFKATSVHVIPR